MNKCLWLLGLCLFAGCATTGVQGGTLSDPEMKQSLQTFATDMMDRVAKGKFSELEATACPEAVIFDIGERGQPTVARGKAEVVALLDSYEKTMGDSGMAFQTTVSRMDCRVDAGPGYCLVEFEQTASAAGQTMPTMKFRGTLIAERYKDHWIWTHWHGSFRELPDMSTMTPPPAAPPEPEPPAAATPAPATSAGG